MYTIHKVSAYRARVLLVCLQGSKELPDRPLCDVQGTRLCRLMGLKPAHSELPLSSGYLLYFDRACLFQRDEEPTEIEGLNRAAALIDSEIVSYRRIVTIGRKTWRCFGHDDSFYLDWIDEEYRKDGYLLPYRFAPVPDLKMQSLWWRQERNKYTAQIFFRDLFLYAKG